MHSFASRESPAQPKRDDPRFELLTKPLV